VAGAGRELESFLTLLLADQAPRPAFSFGIVRVAQSSEVALMEEFEPDRYRVRETFRLGA
jgi:hypothetical protein